MANQKLPLKPVVPIDATTQFAATKIINGVREVVQIAQADLKGLDGKSSIASITGTSPANIPAVGQQVQYAIDNSAGFIVDQIVAINAASTLKVVGIPTSTSIVLENIDATAGAVATGAKILPAAKKGRDGLDSTIPGPQGANAFTTVTTQFTIPAFNASVTAVVVSTAFMSVGMSLQVSGRFFRVASVTSATQVSLTNSLASQTGTIAATSRVVVAGEPGPAGNDLVAITVGTNPNTPAVNAFETYTVDSTVNLLTQHYYGFESVTGTFLVAAILSATTVSLQNIDATVGTQIPDGAKLGPVGKTGVAGSGGGGGGTGGGGGPVYEYPHQIADPPAQAGKILVFARVNKNLYARTEDGLVYPIVFGPAVPPVGGGTGTLVMRDRFNTTTTQTIDAHVPELPASGAGYLVYDLGGNGNVSIAGIVTNGSSLDPCGMTLFGLTLPASYQIKATVSVVTPFSLIARSRPNNSTYFEGIYAGIEGSALKIKSRNTSGTFTTLDTLAITVPTGFFDLQVDVTGTNIAVSIPSIGASLTVSTTDFNSNTSAGLHFAPGTNAQLDKWEIYA